MATTGTESGRPVLIELELSCTEPGEWVAIDHLVGHYGEGATCDEAVSDLLGSLYESRDLLRERRENLGAHLERKLAELETVFGSG